MEMNAEELQKYIDEKQKSGKADIKAFQEWGKSAENCEVASKASQEHAGMIAAIQSKHAQDNPLLLLAADAYTSACIGIFIAGYYFGLKDKVELPKSIEKESR